MVYNIDIEVIMHKKLRQHGTSWGIIIPKPILELLNINPVLDEVELVVENNELKIKKYKPEE